MQTHAVLTLVAVASLGMTAMAQTNPNCRIEPFQGATLPQGAVAHMTISAKGASCSITNYGVPTDRRNPAYSGSITSPPSHGTATFAAPLATYTPETGFAGEDEFAYEAIGKGNIDQQVRLRVRVKVNVLAP
jgi:hypothetical protein